MPRPGLNERYTNATGFLNGHHEAYAASVSLTWALDLGTAPAIRARKAEALAAQAREEEVSLTVVDAVFRAFDTMEADIARSKSARHQSVAAARAAEIARTRYRAGVVTQLEMIQADRDAFAAEAARIQADRPTAICSTLVDSSASLPLAMHRRGHTLVCAVDDSCV